MKKIVVHVTINYGGGIKTVIDNLVKKQRLKYDKVLLAVEKKRLDLVDKSKFDDVLLLYEKSGRYVINGTNLQKLKKEVEKKYGGDVQLIVHGIGVIGLFGNLPKNVIFVQHGHIENDNSFLVRMIYKLIFAKLKRKKVKIVTVSEENAKYFKELFCVDSTTITNGVDVYGEKSNNFVYNIGFAGCINEHKGYEYLLQAGKILSDLGKDFHISIAGKEWEPSKTQRIIDDMQLTDKVTYYGEVNDFANTLLPTYDLMVLPSKMEGLPMCLIEAQAYGIPILATNVGGIAEVLEDGVNGYFIERNGEDIAKKILLCMDKQNYIELSKNSKNVYEQKFTIRQMEEKYSKLIGN